MPCYFPLTAWQGSPGSQPIFEPRAGFTKLQLPCSRCIGCRLEYSRQWAIRCMDEASLHEFNCFITLTYSDEHLPAHGSLRKSDFQDFMKRFRMHVTRKYGYYPIKFFMCGEYGEQLSRPHFHACIFGFDFPDKELWSVRDGVRLFRSPSLESLWPFGHSTIGDVTFESAAYVARYCLKKVVGDGSIEHYSRMTDEGEIIPITPEYADMSRGGRTGRGIGFNWLQQFSSDLNKDFITVNGKKVRPARYYDRILKQRDEVAFNERKLKRVAAVLDSLDKAPAKSRDRGNAKLRQRKAALYIKRQQISQLKRGVENVKS